MERNQNFPDMLLIKAITTVNNGNDQMPLIKNIAHSTVHELSCLLIHHINGRGRIKKRQLIEAMKLKNQDTISCIGLADEVTYYLQPIYLHFRDISE